MRITPELFAAYLRCPTKCWLKGIDEKDNGNAYAGWVRGQAEAYRAGAMERLRSTSIPGEHAMSPPASALREARWRLGSDVFLRTKELECRIDAIERVPSKGRGKPAQFIPIRFMYSNKLSRNDKLLSVFDALVLSEILNRDVATCKIIHGDCNVTLKSNTSPLIEQVRKTNAKIITLICGTRQPDLVLNRHCPECEFRERCRRKAIERDDLSLLSGMTEKERQKCHSKGIFTVTQLSFTYRPRGRKKRDKREKYHHSLKALAIREKKIHIVGTPELTIEGTPVYLDVESLPDRDFYYLIGLRLRVADSIVQHNLWADGPDEEKKIWNQMLEILGQIQKPILIHYGGFETAFLKRMRERYSKATDPSAIAAVRFSINVVSTIFARIYFPTFSNSLKEIAPLLGARWAAADPSGLQSIVWRHSWEGGHDVAAKENLIRYNQEDCAALELLTLELLDVIANARSRLDVDLADEPKAPSTKRASAIHNEFTRVLRSAYSDYSKARIKIRKEPLSVADVDPKQVPRRPAKRPKYPAVRGHIILVPRKRKCQRHANQPTMLRPQIKMAEHALLDLAFTSTGCKQTVVRYIGKKARCPHCNQTYPPPGVKRVRHQVYGRGLHAWVAYLRIALRLSYRLITKATRDVFHLDLTERTSESMVDRWAQKCIPTEELILAQIVKSPGVHVDETKISILGTQQYVWVLTNGRHSIFRLTEGRETGFLPSLLGDFNGVLVSDFYGGYDALPYRQQKCLVHLIGDLNDDLRKHPFDSQYEQFVAAVRDLFLPILADAQKFGPKAYHLRKHQGRVDRFFRDHVDVEPSSGNELVLKYQSRFRRFRNSLFVFLHADGVSWNNNAAERALRHVAVQRKISGAFTSKGATGYLRLLGVAQTCRFQEKSFLDFLLSGCIDIDRYQDRRRPHRPSAFDFHYETDFS